MKTHLIALCAGAALAAGLTSAAVAAPGHGYGHGYGYGPPQAAPGYGAPRGPAWIPVNQRQQNLERRIEQGLRMGGLTRQEAFRLRAEFRQIERLEWQYRRGGLSRWEMADLDQRMDRLSARIYVERRDPDRRYGQGYGYGYGQGRR